MNEKYSKAVFCFIAWFDNNLSDKTHRTYFPKIKLLEGGAIYPEKKNKSK